MTDRNSGPLGLTDTQIWVLGLYGLRNFCKLKLDLGFRGSEFRV